MHWVGCKIALFWFSFWEKNIFHIRQKKIFFKGKGIIFILEWYKKIAFISVIMLRTSLALPKDLFL